MPHRYSTALSHVFLAGTGIYCLTQVGYKEFSLPTLAYGLITTNSIIGVWRYGNPDYGDKVDKVFKVTTLLQTLFAVPCIVAHIWLGYGYQKELAYAHPVISLIPLAAYFADKERKDVLQGVIALNSVSLGAVCAMQKNYFGLAAAVSFLLDFFLIQEEDKKIFDIPSEDLYNYIMCFVSYFGLRAIND